MYAVGSLLFFRPFAKAKKMSSNVPSQAINMPKLLFSCFSQRKVYDQNFRGERVVDDEGG